MAAPRPGLSAPLLLLRGLPGRLPITSRVSLVLLGVGLLPLLTSQWLALQAFKRTLLLNQLEQTGRIAQARVDELEGFVTQTTLALEELAQTPQVREDIRGLVARKAEAPLTSTALSERYRKLAGELRLESLYLADSRGQLLLASQQATPGAAGPSGVPARLSTTLVAATSGFGRGFAGPLADPASRLYLTYLAVPVVNTPGRPLGGVGAALEASGFSRLLGSEHFGLGHSARVSLVGVLTSQRGQRLIPLGPRGEALNGQAHALGDIASENVAEIAGGHAEIDRTVGCAQRQSRMRVIDDLGRHARAPHLPSDARTSHAQHPAARNHRSPLQ